jgi:hypothetical protein
LFEKLINQKKLNASSLELLRGFLILSCVCQNKVLLNHIT